MLKSQQPVSCSPHTFQKEKVEPVINSLLTTTSSATQDETVLVAMLGGPSHFYIGLHNIAFQHQHCITFMLQLVKRAHFF